MKDRAKGILIVLSGVLIISPEAVLTRFLSEGGADPWTIIFWKMLFAIPVAASFALYEAGGISPLWKLVVEGKVYYAVAVPIQAVVDTCFTFAFVYTSAANALLLINLNPLWCAIAGRLFLGDILPYRTYLALLLALGCMIIIFVPEVIEQKHNEGEYENDEALETSGESSRKGNIIALFTGLGLAAYITIVRHGSKAEKPVNLIGVATLSAAFTTILSLIIRKGDVSPASFWTGELWQFWLAQITEGFMIGIIFIVMTIAPRLITGAEVGLCVLLEAVLGPLFVYFAYGDVPSKWTIIGGSLLLTVLAVHESRPLFKKAKELYRSISRRISTRMSSSFAREVEEAPDIEDEIVSENEEVLSNGDENEEVDQPSAI